MSKQYQTSQMILDKSEHCYQMEHLKPSSNAKSLCTEASGKTKSEHFRGVILFVWGNEWEGAGCFLHDRLFVCFSNDL